uniref:Pentacotripeptide-repeat region of PRORP domain-containing protein n=1 Tax=Salix viminalis TaxID=40686 RepID=A0A6N2M0H8_SALVM
MPQIIMLNICDCKVVDVNLDDPDLSHCFQQAIQRFIASSPTVPDAVFAIEFAAASGVDLGLEISCEILRKLVDLGEPLSAHDFYHDHLIAREWVAYRCLLQNTGLPPIWHMFKTLFFGLCKKGWLVEAELVFEEMEVQGFFVDKAIAKNGCGLDHSSLSNFDKINSSAGLEQEIELILREITRIDLNLCNVAGSIYVSALCEGGKTEAALACFKNVASAGCIPLLFTFNSLIKRLFQDGRFEDVKSLFEIMQNEGIVPNLQTYLIMVNEYCKQEDLASAFGILDQMKEMGPKPNVAIYNCIIACLGKQRRISEAETVFHMMHRDGLDHDEVAYMTMINAYTRNGRGDKALNLFEKMIENAIQPSSYSYTALLSGLVKRKIRLKNVGGRFCSK